MVINKNIKIAFASLMLCAGNASMGLKESDSWFNMDDEYGIVAYLAPVKEFVAYVKGIVTDINDTVVPVFLVGSALYTLHPWKAYDIITHGDIYYVQKYEQATESLLAKYEEAQGQDKRAEAYDCAAELSRRYTYSALIAQAVSNANVMMRNLDILGGQEQVHITHWGRLFYSTADTSPSAGAAITGLSAHTRPSLA